jgi:hypothetical protein
LRFTKGVARWSGGRGIFRQKGKPFISIHEDNWLSEAIRKSWDSISTFNEALGQGCKYIEDADAIEKSETLLDELGSPFI